MEEENDHDESPSENRSVLLEANKGQGTPMKTSPEELIIMQRGPRRKPETWSPLDFNRFHLLGMSRDRTPQKQLNSRPEISSKLRRRLNLSPTKEVYGEEIIKRVKCLREK